MATPRNSAARRPVRTKLAGWLAISLVPILIGGCQTGPTGEEPEKPPGPDSFIEHMHAEHGYDRTELRGILAQAERRQSIIDAMTEPAEGQPWHRYRAIFLTDGRVAGGVRFWRNNAEMLRTAEQRYGIPAKILVAIIGVESRYGHHDGTYPVIDALTTLAFHYPPRAAFFRSELEEFLLLARAEDFPVTEVRGSYAGAMGMSQFIASSYRAYAVDFNGDDRRDLWHTHADVIGSVANFLAEHGWRRERPITVPAGATDSDPANLVTEDLEPSTTVAELRAAGIDVPGGVPGDYDAGLMALEMPEDHAYWIGFHNFFVITRYNHSRLYAMAVFQLAEAITARRAVSDDR